MATECRTAAVIHLDRLAANIQNILHRLDEGVELMAVLKGDAYGHGIAGVYPTLRAQGIRRYAVAIWEEGRALRQSGAEQENILILGDTWDDQLDKLLSWRLTPTIFQLETAEKLNALAQKAGVVHPVHIKLDTGMSRIGFPADERALEPIARIAAMKNLRIEGIFTHFSRADETDNAATDRQLLRYRATVEALRARGVSIPLLHTANSPAILLRPDAQFGAVRGGDVLFGLCPIDEDAWQREGIQEVLTWHSYVALVKSVPAGTEIGYGGTYVTERETRLATVPVGFADGYSRALSNRGFVVINGRRAPIRGRVCMDQFMVDVTDIPGVCRGDRVQLLGEGMSILDMADLLGKNVDEIVCGISARVPRVYIDKE